MLNKISFALASLLLAGAAHATLIGEIATNHDTIATAQNVNGSFSTDADANILNSTTIPHVSIRGTGDGTWDMYRFSVSTGGSTATFDIDYGMYDLDSYLKLFAMDGTLLVQHDDGGATDPGSAHGWDSLLNYTFAGAGDYVVAVGRCCSAPLTQGQDYVLNISLANPGNNVPEPGLLGLLGIGALAAAMGRRRA